MIQDSGKRESFGTGAVRDIQDGKGRCDLLPLKEVLRYLKWVIYGLEDDECMGVLWWLDEAIHFHDGTKFVETEFTLEELIFHAVFEFSEEAGWDPYDMIFEMSIHFEEGASKYGERNWEKGIPVSRYFSSAIRHYLKFERGDEDERHDRAVVWNLFCALWTIYNRNYMIDLPAFRWNGYRDGEIDWDKMNKNETIRLSNLKEILTDSNLWKEDEYVSDGPIYIHDRNGNKVDARTLTTEEFEDCKAALRERIQQRRDELGIDEQIVTKVEPSTEKLQDTFAELRANETYSTSSSPEEVIDAVEMHKIANAIIQANCEQEASIFSTIIFYQDYEKYIRRWIEVLEERESPSILLRAEDHLYIPCPTGSKVDSQLEIFNMYLVLRFGDYGVSPRHGWITDIDGCLSFLKKVMEVYDDEFCRGEDDAN